MAASSKTLVGPAAIQHKKSEYIILFPADMPFPEIPIPAILGICLKLSHVFILEAVSDTTQ